MTVTQSRDWTSDAEVATLSGNIPVFLPESTSMLAYFFMTLLLITAPAYAATEFERVMLQELNVARTRPEAYQVVEKQFAKPLDFTGIGTLILL